MNTYRPTFLQMPLIISALTFGLCLFINQNSFSQGGSPSLKDSFKQYFSIGVAVGPKNLIGAEAELIKKQFNSITAENAMKMESIQPMEGVFNWKIADSIVNFAKKNGIRIRGHNLCWHQQVPAWMFIGRDGKEVSKQELLKRLHDHITAVVSRYKGKIYAWDVVNEAIDDNPDNQMRDSKWFKICGYEFIEKAFKYAHDADPLAKLFYNDYNTERPAKREHIYKLLKRLVDKGIPINGVGLQAHWSIFEPSKEELRKSIRLYSSLGLEIQFTELDISVYPWEKENREKRVGEKDDYTVELEQKQADKYSMLFGVFREFHKVITNVTFWNISDAYTWLDDYPVRGRKNYPLLFDSQLRPKKAFYRIVREVKKNK
jgi:endo-1,4-beta-xylanase